MSRRQIIAARFRYVLDEFPRLGYGYHIREAHRSPIIRIPKMPLIRVETIGYLDPEGIPQILPPTDYKVADAFEPAHIGPTVGLFWPCSLFQIGAVWVDFSAGYCAPCTAAAITGTLTVKGWPDLEIGDVVRLSNSGGALPAPLLPHRDYFVESVIAAGTYTLAASSGGIAINITGEGTGTHYLGQSGADHDGAVPDGLRAWMLLRCETLYAHRGETAIARGNLYPLPHVDRLLDPYRHPTL
jgi:hypothetical protein